MPTLYFNTSQVIALLHCFPSVGYMRVQLLQSVFPHIVDLENVWTILDKVLTEDERLEVLLSFLSNVLVFCL